MIKNTFEITPEKIFFIRIDKSKSYKNQYNYESNIHILCSFNKKYNLDISLFFIRKLIFI